MKWKFRTIRETSQRALLSLYAGPEEAVPRYHQSCSCSAHGMSSLLERSRAPKACIQSVVQPHDLDQLRKVRSCVLSVSPGPQTVLSNHNSYFFWVINGQVSLCYRTMKQHTKFLDKLSFNSRNLTKSTCFLFLWRTLTHSLKEKMTEELP